MEDSGGLHCFWRRERETNEGRRRGGKKGAQRKDSFEGKVFFYSAKKREHTHFLHAHAYTHTSATDLDFSHVEFSSWQNKMEEGKRKRWRGEQKRWRKRWRKRERRKKKKRQKERARGKEEIRKGRE